MTPGPREEAERIALRHYYPDCETGSPIGLCPHCTLKDQITAALKDERRRGLEDAFKAICKYCAKGFMPESIGPFIYGNRPAWIHHGIKGETQGKSDHVFGVEWGNE